MDTLDVDIDKSSSGTNDERLSAGDLTGERARRYVRLATTTLPVDLCNTFRLVDIN